jgi:outer membrane protein, heavy metal efflux system
MKVTAIASALLMAITAPLMAQSDLDSLLVSVNANNKQLKAARQYSVTAGRDYATGITLPDPFVEYDYLSGGPETAGPLQELKVTQSFDFPTVYGKRKQLAELQGELSLSGYDVQRQDILSEARELYLKAVYQRRNLQWLEKRKQETEVNLNAFERRLNADEGNILDVNKARLQLIAIGQKHSKAVTELEVTLLKLKELNGGVAPSINEWVYPETNALPEFETFEKEYEERDPHRIRLEKERQVAAKQQELSKSLWWPRMEVGYRYEDTPGQSFNGIHTGITIPLWQHRNTVKKDEQMLLYTGLELESHLSEHYHQLKANYEEYLQLSKALEEYNKVFAGGSVTQLLSKALAAGQIDASEYFQETSFYDSAYIDYLESELRLHLVMNELFKYKL